MKEEEKNMKKKQTNVKYRNKKKFNSKSLLIISQLFTSIFNLHLRLGF